MASAGRETQSLITADKLKEAKAHHSLPVEQKKKEALWQAPNLKNNGFAVLYRANGCQQSENDVRV